MKLRHTLTVMAFTLCVMPVMAQSSIAQQVVDDMKVANSYFMEKHPDPTQPTFVKRKRPSSLWTRGVYFEGLMALNDISPDKSYVDYVDRWAAFHKWTPRNGTTTTNADDQCCTQTYLMRYQQVGGKEKMDSVVENFRRQMATGRVDYWTWIDAIQMAMPAYAHLSELTGDKTYIDYAMKLYMWTRNECGGGLWNDADGLWWRDADFVPPYAESDGNRCYWSRGNGWVYVALIRVMDHLPKSDSHYKALKKDFIKMSQALAACQRADGFWNVSLHSPSTFGGRETSGTSLFLAGMSWGIRNGLLPANQYLTVCNKAWRALASEAVHENGFLGYVQGTGKEPKDGQPTRRDREPDFDDFGLGCFLLGGAEYYKLITQP